MTTQEAIDNLEYLLNQLYNSQDRFTDETLQDLIKSIEDHAIPALKERVRMEKIADEFNRLGNPGEILSKEELEKALGIYEQRIYEFTEVKGVYHDN